MSNRTPDADLLEADFQTQVLDLARATGWKVNHTRKSIGKGNKWVTATSIRGWPDLFFYSPRRQQHFFVELKKQDGRVSDEQTEVLFDLNAAGVEAFVWRPSDWPELQERLTRR